MKKLLQLGLILVGSIALSFTLVNATCGSGKEAPKSTKYQADKSGSKEMKCGNSKDMKKETNTTKPTPTPPPKKGKCSSGKCG